MFIKASANSDKAFSFQGQERSLRILLLRQPRHLAFLLRRRPLLQLHDDPHLGGREPGHRVGEH